MKKVLLIDDRPDRQNSLLESNKVRISDFENNILDNIKKIEGNNEYHNLKDKILNKDFESLNEYLVIMVHRSAFEDKTDEVIENLKSYCLQENKNLVLFSGGISASFYTDLPQKILLINSKLFYGHNLKLFLEHILNPEINKPEKVELLLLSYGNDWEKNLLLNCLEKINYFELMEDIESSDFDDLETETNINIIKDIINFDEPNEENLQNFITYIKTKILQKVVRNG